VKTYIVVDDHPLFRRGVIEVLKQNRQYSLAGEAGNGEEALSLCRTRVPDIALVDIALGGGENGLNLIECLAALYPPMLILVISMHDEALYAERCINAGAKGYVMKQEASVKIMKALEEILSGRLFVSPDLREKIGWKATHVRRDPAVAEKRELSEREAEILTLIGQGNGPADISKLLELHIKTVESYMARLKCKLGVAGAAELRKFAVGWLRVNRR
jgi:DNA-binding NarL/FixJ family response regulator